VEFLFVPWQYFVCAVAIFCLCREGFCLCRGAFVCAMTPMGHRIFNKLEHSIGKINHKKKNNFQNRKFIFVKDWQGRNFGITAGVGGAGMGVSTLTVLGYMYMLYSMYML
jgi:hypothetical protein